MRRDPGLSPEAIRGADAAAALADETGVGVLRSALAAGPLEVVARGASMRPTLEPGDRVRLVVRGPRRGDVVLAVREGRLLLHRAARRRGDAWLLRGDARPRADGWVRTSEILGVVESVRSDTPEWRRVDGALLRAIGLARAAVLSWLRRARASRAGARGRRPRATRWPTEGA